MTDMKDENKTKKQLINELIELRQRIFEVEETFKESKKTAAGMEKELDSISMELAISLFEVFEALKKISSGDPEVRIAEESEVEIISKLKYMVNMTAKDIGELVEQSHEFAMVLTENFDVLHRVSKGDLSARVSGEPTIELLEALKNVTNEMIASIGREINGRKEAEMALRESEEKYRTLINDAEDAIILTDLEGNLLEANKKAEKLLGYTKQELLNMRFSQIPPKTALERAVFIFNEMVQKGSWSFANGLVFQRKDGDIIHVDIAGSVIEYSGKKVVQGIIRDITERKKAEDSLRESENKYKTLIENLQQKIFLKDTNLVYLSCNEKYARDLKIYSNEINGKTDYDFFPKELAEKYRTDDKRIIESGNTEEIEEIYIQDGKEKFVQTVKTAVKDKKGNVVGILGIFWDITERKKMEERLHYLAYYDALTGLPNRSLFLDRLTQGIARADYNKRLIAVLLIDIDRFKFINDTHGLDAGDKVLKELAEILSASTRQGDTVARLGGDDFGIILIDIANSEDVILVIENIMKNVSQPIKVKEEEIVLTITVGIALYPTDGKDTTTLMKNADLALLKAKKQGRKNYQFYTEDMDVKASEFLLMEKYLFNALKNEEFILYYQPYWDINRKKIRGVEALIRWQSRDFGLVSPGKFMPVLEETGMIIEVGEWIFKTACRQAVEWYKKGHPVIPVSVNLSSGPTMSPFPTNPGYPVVPVSMNLSLVQFRQKDMAEMMERIIKESGVDPRILTMEITESTFMHDVEYTSSIIKKIKDMGISISIDDFGTGYSSLSHLKRLPIDNLKIDISFIRDIATDPDSASIVMAIISMAHTLNLKTIAEGIETEEQLKILRLLRCDMGQGYYFSRPVPAEEIEKMLI